MATPSNPYKKPSKPTKAYQSPSLQSTSASSHTSPPSPLPLQRITRSQYRRGNPPHLGDSTTHRSIMQDIKDAINDKESKSLSVRKFSGPSNLPYKSKKQKREAKQTKITSYLNKTDKEYLDKRISFLEDHLRKDPTSSQTTLNHHLIHHLILLRHYPHSTLFHTNFHLEHIRLNLYLHLL